jgi:ankyrin repeat protein
MVKSDLALRELVGAIIEGNSTAVSRQLSMSPLLVRASFQTGASRQTAKAFFLDKIGRYIYAGDTTLHIAAAAHQTEIASKLLAAGANIHAVNRRGQEALHAASVGSPGSPQWNPPSQAATIILLIEAGADPNVLDQSGVSPLHKAIRTRCAEAVRTLLACGADPVRPNKSGSTPMLLATLNTGRGGSGSPEAKAQQQEIALMLEQALA